MIKKHTKSEHNVVFKERYADKLSSALRLADAAVAYAWAPRLRNNRCNTNNTNNDSNNNNRNIRKTINTTVVVVVVVVVVVE